MGEYFRDGRPPPQVIFYDDMYKEGRPNTADVVHAAPSASREAYPATCSSCIRMLERAAKMYGTRARLRPALPVTRTAGGGRSGLYSDKRDLIYRRADFMRRTVLPRHAPAEEVGISVYRVG